MSDTECMSVQEYLDGVYALAYRYGPSLSVTFDIETLSFSVGVQGETYRVTKDIIEEDFWGKSPRKSLVSPEDQVARALSWFMKRAATLIKQADHDRNHAASA